MLAEITYAKMSTFLVVSLVIYHGLAYQNNVFNQTLKLFNYYLAVVSWYNMTAKRGGQQMLVCDKLDMSLTVLACFFVILTEHFCVLASFKKIYQKKGEVQRKVFQKVIIILVLSHTICCLLPSPILLCKFTNICGYHAAQGLTVASKLLYLTSQLNCSMCRPFF